jgi:dolichol-phosphate mannosyltransferase
VPRGLNLPDTLASDPVALPAELAAEFRCLSVVVPLRDEVDSIDSLLHELDAALGHLPLELEWIVVDDASNDGSLARLRDWMRKDARLRVLSLAEHGGQAAALGAGFRAARGEVVATLDADGQNDPADIPRLLAGLTKADVVNGVRTQRRDNGLRRFSSRLANAVRRSLLDDEVSDIGCSLRVMRARYVRRVKLYRGLHRFLPVLLELEGARIAEVPVAHRARRFGETKYGIRNRLPEAVVDLLVVAWMQRRAHRLRATEER